METPPPLTREQLWTALHFLIRHYHAPAPPEYHTTANLVTLNFDRDHTTAVDTWAKLLNMPNPSRLDPVAVHTRTRYSTSSVTVGLLPGWIVVLGCELTPRPIIIIKAIPQPIT